MTISKKALTKRRALILRIRLAGVMDLDEMAAELARLSAGRFQISGRTCARDLKAVLEGEEHRIPAGQYRRLQLARYEAMLKHTLIRLEKAELVEDIQEAGRLTLRILARIDKVSGAETHVKRVQLGGEVAIGRPVSEAEHAAALAAIRGGVES